MEIINVKFEEKLIINIKDEQVTLVPFQTSEHGNCKFGVETPRVVSVNREEIYQLKQAKAKS